MKRERKSENISEMESAEDRFLFDEHGGFSWLKNPRAQMFFASCLALFLELAVVRWLGSEIHIFAFLGNIPLILIFFALGFGAAMAKPRVSVRRGLPYAMPFILAFFGMTVFTVFSSVLLPTGSDVWVWNTSGAFLRTTPTQVAFAFVPYLLTLGFYLSMTFVLFFGIGEVLREKLQRFSSPLDAYAFDLAGSMAGVLIFTGMSFLQLSPVWWVLFGLLLLFLVIKIPRPAILIALIAVIIVWIGTSNAVWSPDYMIQVAPNVPAYGSKPDAINLYVNESYFHQMVDLSSSSVAEHATDSVITEAVADYDFPYRFITHLGSVLVVGAGSGNDVASALRHGATHVDVVEIDPGILQLGKELHPEHPYNDPRVTLHVNDARSFFETTDKKYNTIVYGLLDSHASISSFSDVRLDNFVYTQEGFAAAKQHLATGGSVVISFGAGDDWLLQRIETMIQGTYGQDPLVFHRIRGYGGIFIVGDNLNPAPLKDPAVSGLLIKFDGPSKLPIPTDDWPYLYLQKLRHSRHLPRHALGRPCARPLSLKKNRRHDAYHGKGDVYEIRIVLFPWRGISAHRDKKHRPAFGAFRIYLGRECRRDFRHSPHGVSREHAREKREGSAEDIRHRRSFRDPRHQLLRQRKFFRRSNAFREIPARRMFCRAAALFLGTPLLRTFSGSHRHSKRVRRKSRRRVRRRSR